jgi:predicted dehydrogenase
VGAPPPLRIGIAGTGFGAAVHLPALKALPGVEIVAIAGANPARTQEIAARHGIALACDGVAALLDQPLDAVALALPPALGEAAAGLALGRGLAVLAEKPLAATAPAAEALARRAGGLATVVDFEFAELDSFAALRSALGARGIERIAIRWTGQSSAQRRQAWSWKSDATAGGGVMSLLGTHVLHLLELLCGPVTVTAAESDSTTTRRFAPPGAIAGADRVAFAARGAAGTEIAVLLDNAADTPAAHRWEITAAGSGIVWETLPGSVARFRLTREGAAIAEDPASPGDERLRPFSRLAERFVAAARIGLPCAPDFAAGARVQRLVAAIEAAATPQRAAS